MSINQWPLDGGWGDGGGGGAGGGGPVPGATSDARNIEYGRLILALGEGPGYTLVNGLKSVYLNETPIQNADNSFNFSGVALAMVSGTNTQGVIPGFPSVESETSVNVKATFASPVSRSIATAGLSAVRVRIAIPALKKIDPNTGSESGVQVQIKIERQRTGYNGGAYETVTLDNTGIIQGKFGSKYTKGFRIELPNTGTGAWTIRVSRLTADHVSGAPDYTQDETWWDSYTELTDARLRYPNTALLALMVDSVQFSSVPRVSADVYLREILVPSNYEPATRTYNTTGFGTTGGIWDGTFGDRATSTLNKKVWSDNPAWQFYDVATDTRSGCGNYLNAARLDKSALYAIAQVCDALVDNGHGGTEPRFTCNLYLQSQEDAVKVLSHMASAFRSMMYWSGGQVTCVQDVDASPVAVFTNADVVDGRFTYEGTARKARHNAALVGWIDPAQGYRSAVEYCEDAPAIARYGYNPVQVQGFGVTSQGQARRLGLWTILTETMKTEMVSFKTGMRGSVARPGEIIQIQDQFRAGLTRMGGRVGTGSTTTVVQLDAPVTLGAGTYTLKCQMSNGTLETRTVTTGAGTVTALTVGSAYSSAPTGPWLLQLGTTAALYRVLGVREASPLDYEVTAFLHDPSIYALIETGLNITPTDGPPISAFPPVTSLAGATSTRTMNDRLVVVLTANWLQPVVAAGAAKPSSYVAECSRDFNPWQFMNVSAQSAELVDAPPGSYRVRVVAVYPGGNSIPVQTTVSVGDSTGTDDYVTPDKKREIKTEWTRIKTEQTALDARAVVAGVSSTTYDNAITALYTYLDGLTDIGGSAGGAWTGSSSTGDWTSYTVTCYLGSGGGATMRADWNAVYAARDALLTAVNGPLFGTDYLTGAQKLVVKQQRDYYYNGFNTATTGLKARAVAAGVSWSACDTAITALDTHLATLTSADGWNNATKDWKTYNTLYLGSGGGATLQSKFKDVIDAYSALEGAVENVLATAATNALAAAPALVTALPGTCSAEYITAANDRTFAGAGNWTGTGWSVSSGVFAHTAGANTATLANVNLTAAPVNGEGYQISMKVTTTTEGTLNVLFGGGSTGAITMTPGEVEDYIVGISCTGAGSGVQITPDANWVGSIDNVSVKKTSSPGAGYPTGKLVYLTANWTDASGVVGPTNKIWPTTIYRSDLTGNVYRWKVAATMADQIIGKLIAGQISAGAIGANALAALLILTNDIRSFNYSAGTSGAGPTGYRLSGTTFTTTYLGGATDSTCQFEMGGSANFGGYKVATVNTRVFSATNRLQNGWMYKTILPWNAAGTNLPTWNSTGPIGSYYGSARHSTVVAAAGATTTKTGDISQAVVLPVSSTTANTVKLELQTGYILPANCDSTGTYIKAYIFDPAGSGTETLVGTRTYDDSSGVAHSLAWDTNSWDISSYVGGGGTYAVRIELRAVILNNDSISHNMDVCVGDVKIVI